MAHFLPGIPLPGSTESCFSEQIEIEAAFRAAGCPIVAGELGAVEDRDREPLELQRHAAGPRILEAHACERARQVDSKRTDAHLGDQAGPGEVFESQVDVQGTEVLESGEHFVSFTAVGSTRRSKSPEARGWLQLPTACASIARKRTSRAQCARR